MQSIEIDFDVFKELTLRRESEAITFNDVIRRLLKLEPAKRTRSPEPPIANDDAWVTKGVVFPAGTEFRAAHKGVRHSGRVEAGALVVGGSRYNSPSAAAVAITGNSVNGWTFWECRNPGEERWRIIASLRTGQNK